MVLAKYVNAQFQSGGLILVHHARSSFSEGFGGGGWLENVFSGSSLQLDTR